jgi:hypothetical protein
LRRVGRLLLLGLLSFGVLLATLWGMLALQHRASSPHLFSAALCVAAGVALLMVWRRDAGLAGWPAGLVVFLVCLGVLAWWWRGVAPQADRVWAQPLSRLPVMTIAGDELTVQNVRTFRWEATPGTSPPDVAERVAEARWETRTYRLSQARGVDLFFSYWTGPWIAHLVVSATFDEQPPLAFSVEIRREEGERYSPLAGFFKQYELAIVAADETDVIRLRTDVWQEDVRLYRLKVTPEQTRTLLTAYAREIAALNAAPRWYHTVFANCATVAFRIARQVWPGLQPDWRIVAAGYAPDYAHAIGAVATDIPLAELKAKAAISARARAATNDADFSRAIREGVPTP